MSIKISVRPLIPANAYDGTETLGVIKDGADKKGMLGDIMNIGSWTVRGTVGNIVNGAVGNAVSAAVALPAGYKKFRATISGAGAVAQVIDIYGGETSAMTVATSDKLGTITLSGASGGDGTSGSIPPFIGIYPFYLAVTSGSTGTPTTVVSAFY